MRRILLGVVCLAMAATSVMARKHAASKPQIPILAWYSVPSGEFQTLERYQELRECGFTISFGHLYGHDESIKALDLCHQAGIKSMFMSTALQSETEKTVAEVKNHPGLAGYFLQDEPGDDSMDELGEWARKVRATDPNPEHTIYLNLLPRHAFADSAAYQKHLQLFTSKVALPQISYDHYPVNQSGDTIYLNPAFYENLEMVSAEARRVGVPFWAFALATAHAAYPVPRLEHLRLELYADLAYGAQCLQYFTYWNPGTDTWDFHQAPVTLDGRRSGTYEVVREMNQELQQRAFVFVGCQVESLYHMGNNIPSGTKRLPSLPAHFLQLDTHGQGALISTLTNNGARYYVIQNTSPNHMLKLDLMTDDTLQLVRRDGTLQPANIYGPYFQLEVGDVLIFKSKEKI